jgi:hypothetical protein
VKQSRYYTNKSIRTKIDKLLFKNAVIQAGLGTESTEEEKEDARKHTKEIAYSIYEIDKEFATSNFLEVDFKDIL